MSSPSLRWQITVREPSPEVARQLWHDLPGSCMWQWQLEDEVGDNFLVVSLAHRYDATDVVAYLLAVDQSFSFRVRVSRGERSTDVQS